MKVSKADKLINPFERIWFKYWLGLLLNSSGEGGKNINGDICKDIILI